jgi:hypothetical protein
MFRNDIKIDLSEEKENVINALKYRSYKTVIKIVRASGPIPIDSIVNIHISMRERVRKDAFTTTFSWAVPSRNCVNRIVKFASGDIILEVGAGNGLWGAIIQSHPTKPHYIPTDNFTSHGFKQDDTYTHVQRYNAAQVPIRFPQCNVLIMIWPPFLSSMAWNALRVYQGEKLVYIGESLGGCTGDDKFHQMIKDEWDLHDTIKIPQWEGNWDKCYLYTRK